MLRCLQIRCLQISDHNAFEAGDFDFFSNKREVSRSELKIETQYSNIKIDLKIEFRIPRFGFQNGSGLALIPPQKIPALILDVTRISRTKLAHTAQNTLCFTIAVCSAVLLRHEQVRGWKQRTFFPCMTCTLCFAVSLWNEQIKCSTLAVQKPDCQQASKLIPTTRILCVRVLRLLLKCVYERCVFR